MYWSESAPDFQRKYHSALRRLHDRLNTDQFVWCYPAKNLHYYEQGEGKDEIEWELDVPSKKILAILDTLTWDQIIQGVSDSWDQVFVRPPFDQPIAHELTVLVAPPFDPGEVRRIGTPVSQSQESKQYQLFMRNLQLSRLASQ